MARIRRPLLQLTVWLTAAGTLFAGAPHFLCQCPVVKSSSNGSATADASPCCCCCSAVTNETDEGPSCCTPTATPTAEDSEPSFRTPECKKALVEPHTATFERGAMEDHVPALQFLTSTNPYDHDFDIPSSIVAKEVGPLPPPVDRQLVLKHFLI